MNISELLPLITYVIALILGKVSKKSKFISDNLIPVQNILIGLIVAVIDFIITKDFKTAIAVSGLIAGGSYDIIHNLDKMRK